MRIELIRPLTDILRQHANLYQDKVAFSDNRRDVTYAELAQRTRRLAGHLAGLGLGRGDRAAILLPSGVEVVES